MTAGKVFVLVVYLGIAGFYWLSRGTSYEPWIIGFVILAEIVHVIEVLVFRQAAREAKGSTFWHLANVLVFGIFHRSALNADRET